jgi:hypothetical protein
MDRVERRPLTSRSGIAALASFPLVVGMLGVLTPDAVAVKHTCWATNLTRGTPSRSNLQAAVNAAHPGDKIAVAGVCVGSFTIDRNLTLVGRKIPDGAKPVLHGQRGSGHVVRVAARVTLTNLKVTGGVANTGGVRSGDTGGGIRVAPAGVLTLTRSRVSGNRAAYRGGGIANYGRLTLNSSVVVGNRAGAKRDSTGGGGGIVNLGKLTLNGSSEVRGNRANNTGGGIENYDVLIMNGPSSVRGNTAELGGGIFLASDRPRYKDPTVTMNDASSVRGNSATKDSSGGNGVGGGIFIFNEGTVTLRGSSSVSRNSAPATGGGGIVNWFGTAVLKDSSSVHDNTGVGIWNFHSSTTLRGSSSVRGNTQGGIFNDEGSTLTLTGSTSVTGNTSDGAGGAIRNNGDLTLKDSASVFDNASTLIGGGVYNTVFGTTTACDDSSADEWIGTIEPNDPNDFLDSDVSLIPGGTGACA